MRTRSVKPVTCIAFCLARPSYPTTGTAGEAGVVSINGTNYILTCHGRTSRDGYRLENEANGKVYDIETESGFPVCDCPDYLSRRGTTAMDCCKHGLALIKLRKEKSL